MDNTRPKQGYGYIYKYTSPSGKSYIGQAINSLKQRAGHNGKQYKGCAQFYQAIQKYGFENFEVEILAEVPQEQLNEMETKYIQIFNTLSPNGYNISAGGKSFSYNREKRKVYQYSTEDGHLIKEWNSRKDAEQSFGVSTPVLQSVLEGRSFTQWGYHWSYLKMDKFPINERLINPTEKKVEMYSLQGEYIKSFKSIAEAARETDSERSAIKRCCRGELHYHNGFIWKCTEILYEKKFHNTARPVQQIDPNTNEVIHVFKSISAAARAFDKGTSRIRQVLNLDDKTAYGYKWKTTQGSTTIYP